MNNPEGFSLKETAYDATLVFAVQALLGLAIFVGTGLYVVFRYGVFA